MNIEQALTLAKSNLVSSSSDSIALDAELLLAYTLKQNRTYLYTWPEKEVEPALLAHFNNLVEQRQQGKPIAHLVGQKEFWGLSLRITPDTLIPRPDTEILVEAALEKMQPQIHEAWSFLDLGTGSGAIACALKASCRHCIATAVDLHSEALSIAQENAHTHQLDIEFKQGNWFEPIGKSQYDLIVSNPPYIEEDDPHLSSGDVRFDPITALTSGADGLKDIEFIVQHAQTHLLPDGWLLIEHGYNQDDAVQALFARAGFQQIETLIDFGQQPRVTLGQKPTMQ